MAKNKYEELKDNGIPILQIKYDFKKNGIVFLITTVIFTFLTGVFLNLCLRGTIGEISLSAIFKLSFLNPSAYGIGIVLSIVVQIFLIAADAYFQKEEPYDIETIVKKGFSKKEDFSFNPIGGIESLILNKEDIIEEEIEIEEMQDEISIEDFIKQKEQEKMAESESTSPSVEKDPSTPTTSSPKEAKVTQPKKEVSVKEVPEPEDKPITQIPKRVVVAVDDDNKEDILHNPQREPPKTPQSSSKENSKNNKNKGKQESRKQEILDIGDIFLGMKK